MEIISSDYTHESYGSNRYRFMPPLDVYVLTKKYIYVKLIRMKDENVQVFDDSKTDKIDNALVENAIKSENRIFINTESGAVAHTLSSIDRDVFGNIFIDLLNGCVDLSEVEAENPFVGVDKIVTTDYDFDTEYKAMSKVFRIDIKLRPTNPHAQEYYEDIDERLRALNVARNMGYSESYSAEKGKSLNSKEDDEISQKIAMAQDEYGVVEIRGLDASSQKLIINTRGEEKHVVLESDLTYTEMAQRLDGFLRSISNS